MKLSASLLAIALGAKVVKAASLVQQNKNDDSALDMLKERELQAGTMCRCEASWENLYNRRLEEELQQSVRHLIHHFDYSSQVLGSDGLWVVEGVKVMPSYSPFCAGWTYVQQRTRHEGDFGIRKLVEANFEQDVAQYAPQKKTTENRRTQCK